MPLTPEERRHIQEEERERERVRVMQRAVRARLELKLYAVLALVALVVLWAIGHSIRSH